MLETVISCTKLRNTYSRNAALQATYWMGKTFKGIQFI